LSVQVVFETHSWSEDNDRGVATGWNPGALSAKGRALASELGERRRNDGIAAVYTSDLRRATETVEIAFRGSEIPILHDWRLRECNYGTSNGMLASELHRTKADHLECPYPDGESWSAAIERVGWFLRDLALVRDGQRVLVVGHVATSWGLQHFLEGRPLAELVAAGFDWRLGWEYQLRPESSLGEAETNPVP